MDPDAEAAVAERYARFARDEAPGRSALYERWATGVATDATARRIVAGIRADRRAPALVFAVTRMLGAPEEDFPVWLRWLEAHADVVAAECAQRSVQTNEPQRCAALLPALALVDGPIALLEIGAAAGLCLFPDRYSYRYRGPDRTVGLDPADGESDVVLACELRGGGVPPLRLPEIVWRAGIDVDPLDPADPADRGWLTGLVWPGETGRVARITAALDIAAADPPVIHRGDAVALLGAVAASAPRGATLVVTTPGVLPHVPRARRHAVIDAARAAGTWITLDAPTTHDAWSRPIDPATWPDDAFAVAVDGVVIAAADPLGRFVEWRHGLEPTAR